MFHIVGSANRMRYERELTAMHAARASVFGGRPHGGPDAIAGLGPRDRYDDDEALYLIRLDSFGDIVCCCRLRPAAPDSMIGAHFGQALAGAIPPFSLSNAWEFSHYYARDAVGSERREIRAEMRLALLAAALDAGVSRILSVIEAEHWPTIERSGWNAQPLGEPVVYGPDAKAVVYSISVQAEDLAAFRDSLARELRLGLGGDPHDAVAVADSLDPGSLDLLAALSRAIAAVEQAEGIPAALALVENLAQAVTDRAFN
jgi:N-acyl-L-homoserine lactone synthetase